MCHPKPCRTYLQALLEAGRLVLRVLGDGGVGAAALARPRLAAPAGVPVLVGGLLHLSPHLHRLLRVGLRQRLGGEQAQVWGKKDKRGVREGSVGRRDAFCDGPACSLSLREPARPLMTVTGFLESVQNCSSTGEKASLLLSS